MTTTNRLSHKPNAEKRKALLLAFRSSFGGRENEDSMFHLSLPVLKAFAEATPEVRAGYDIQTELHTLDADEEALMEMLYRRKPDVLGFSTYVWNLDRSIRTARKVKCVLPETQVVFGGPEVDDAEYILSRNRCVDCVVRGEGEETFRDFLLWRLRGAPNLEDIPGLAFRRGEDIVINPPRPEIRDLASVPSVHTPELLQENTIVYYESSRGCRVGCRYCREGAPGKRYYPLERVERDLKEILSRPDIRTLNFIDTVMDDDVERAKEIFRIVARHNRHCIACGGYFYFAKADAEFFDLMPQANFRFARTGVESTNPDVLKEIGRGAGNVSRLEAALPWRDRIQLTPYIILFLPKDTPATFRQTVRDCFDRGYFYLDFHCTRLRIYPGTPLYRDAEKYGIVFDRDPPHFVYETNTFSYADYMRAKRLVANLTILCRIFKEDGAAEIQDAGFDIFKAAETIDEIIPEWSRCYSFMSEDVVTEVEFGEQAYDLMKAYAARVIGEKKTIKNIRNLIARRKLGKGKHLVT